MIVNNVNSTGSGYGTNNVQLTKGNSDLGKDEFLKLLVTQLKYQDPLNPMEDKEFIAQTAQFTALEQMTNINQNFSQFMRMQAISNTAALIGKEVSYMIIDDESEEIQTLSGIVTEVTFADGTAYLSINGEDVPIEMMVSVKEGTPETEDGSSDGEDDSTGEDDSSEVDGTSGE